METRSIGTVDATVAGLGCNQLVVTVGAREAAAVVGAAVDTEVLLFDTADEYGAGNRNACWGAALS